MNRPRLAHALRVSFVLHAACSNQATVGLVDNDAALAAPVDAGTVVVRTDASTAGCEPAPMIAVCDPIHNSGCSRTLQMQCDVDLEAATLSGKCVFSAETPTSGLCLNIPPTESCPPGQTCVDGDQCHTLCLCDADCPAGECCKTALGALGFKTCIGC